MSGLSDIYDLTDAERLALCQELGRLTRIVPLSLSPAPEAATPRSSRSPAAAGAGDSFPEHGATA